MYDFIIANWVPISASIGALVTFSSIIVKLTPTPRDDAILAKILVLLNLLALNPKK